MLRSVDVKPGTESLGIHAVKPGECLQCVLDGDTLRDEVSLLNLFFGDDIHAIVHLLALLAFLMTLGVAVHKRGVHRRLGAVDPFITASLDELVGGHGLTGLRVSLREPDGAVFAGDGFRNHARDDA